MVDQVPLLPYNLYMVEPYHLPVRQPDDDEGPDYIVRAEFVEQMASGIVLRGWTVSGLTLAIKLQFVEEGIVRVLLADEGQDPDAGRVRLARTLPAGEPPRLERTEGHIALQTASMQVRIALQPFHMAFYDASGRTLLSQNFTEVTCVRMKLTVLPFGVSAVHGQRVAFHDSFTAEPDEHFFGLGEKFTDFDKRGQRITTWNYDCGGGASERSYKNVPFFVSTRKYGVFVDSTCAVDFDLVASNTATFSLVSPDRVLDYYVMAGVDLKAVIARYARLVSLPILPPKWSLGTWISSSFQRDSAEEVLKRARLIRAYEIPCDVLHLDCYWQRFGRWSELLWDREMFPDPEGMLAELKGMGFKVCLWIHPYIGTASERFREGQEQGYFLKNPQGETYIVDMWGGWHPPVAVLDVTHPAAVAWFQDLLREPLRIGVDVYKTDFGEGIPIDAVAYSGIDGEHLHNLYALLYNDLVAQVTEEETGHSGLVWARSTYAGGQRHAAQWSGDINSTFTGLASTLRSGLSMAMCGHAFWSHDVGGFNGHPTPVLYARWAQFGLLSPMVRAHGNSTRLPWTFGEEALSIFREYARLRVRLLPYLYTYACQAAETGLPMMRPMVLEFPDDALTYTMDLQYMLGEYLLVAPLYNESGERPVYLPEGRWVDFWSGTVLTGPCSLHVHVPLSVMPLYVRANALLPTTEPTPFTPDGPFALITVDAYLLDRGSFTLLDTDGATTIEAAFVGHRLELQVAGAKQQLHLRVVPLEGAPGVSEVAVNGALLTEDRGIADVQPAHTWKRLKDGAVYVTMDTADMEEARTERA